MITLGLEMVDDVLVMFDKSNGTSFWPSRLVLLLLVYRFCGGPLPVVHSCILAF